MELNNGILLIDFDERTGCPHSLKDLRTGFEHINRPQDAALFRLLVPSETWQSRYIDSERQQARVEVSDGRAVIIYSGLRTAPVDTDGNCDILDMQVVVTVDLPPGADEVALRMEITNASPSPVSEVWFPRLGGWTGCAGPAHDRLTPGYQGFFDRLNPHEEVIGLDWTTFLRGHRRWAVRYPLATYLPWMDLSGGGHGLYLINYMQEPFLGGFAAENTAPRTQLSLVFGWFSTAEIAPGARWSSPRFGIGLHSGDWHVVARRYRDWLKTWWRPVQPPARLERALGIQHVMFSTFDGEPIRPFRSLPDVARAGLKYGIQDVVVWDYRMLGTYGRVNPGTLTDYPAAQWAELRQALTETRALDVHTGMLINQRLVSPTSDFFRSGGEPGAMRLRDGWLRPEPTPVSGRAAEIWPQWMGPMAVVMCPRSKEYRQEFQYHLDRLMDIGFSSFFIDQSFEYLPCYAPNHGHTRPDDTHLAVVEWIRAFRDRLRAREPEGYIMGEMPDVFTPLAIDLLWNWNWFRRNPDIMAYSMPEMFNAWVTDRDYSAAQNGFLYGLLLMFTTNGLEGTLDDDPAFGQYIQRLGRLRSRTAHLTVRAQFEDMDGLTCDGALARRFTYGGGRGGAVVVVNQGDTPAKARLALNPLEQVFSGPSHLHRLDGTTVAIPADGDCRRLEVDLQPRDVLVWEIPHRE
jgi:hypothetical protein